MNLLIDVCNGVANGLCSVVQWRLHVPETARLVTGLKREIDLLSCVQAGPGDQLLVCDLSMQRNHQPLFHLLRAGVSVRYFDHHKVDKVPVHPLLDAHIDTASDTGTGLLMDRYLHGEFRAWAIVGAFGDNLNTVAEGLVTALGLSFEDRRRLQSLGEAINYNAYGEGEQDVYMAPAQLYEALVRYRDPLDFLKQESIGAVLDSLRRDDMQRAQAWPPYLQDARVSVHLLPQAAWSRRVSGSLGNFLAYAQPQHAHAVLSARPAGDFEVSVRAPLCTPGGAAEFCRLFGGDRRAAAAGIDHLPADQLGRFIHTFSEHCWANIPAMRPDL
jgi:hypothetical protein